VPTSPSIPPSFRDLALLPSPEGAPPLPPPIHIPPPTANIGQPPAAPVETAEPKLNLGVPKDAAQIQQRLFDLGFLATPADGKWGQRSARALQDFRAAHNLTNSGAWDRRTEDELLSPPTAPSPDKPPLFAGTWRPEVESCGADGDEAPLRITSARAETAGGRCDFDSVWRESEGTWRVRAKCSVNGETWQANILLRVTGQRLIWNSEHGRAQYLRCK
jgi:peptidoglycan hydrolase-like protein with peptidoglycan-binding domain